MRIGEQNLEILNLKNDNEDLCIQNKRLQRQITQLKTVNLEQCTEIVKLKDQYQSLKMRFENMQINKNQLQQNEDYFLK